MKNEIGHKKYKRFQNKMEVLKSVILSMICLCNMTSGKTGCKLPKHWMSSYETRTLEEYKQVVLLREKKEDDLNSTHPWDYC